MRISDSNLWNTFRAISYLLLVFGLAACSSDDDPIAPPPVTNEAPVAATIDAAAGGPADGATAVALDAALHWSGSDPDGDALLYTVHFGTSDTPPVVAEDLDATSYTPASMAHATTYFWSVVSTDPDGESTSSTVWTFTTVAATVETVTAPEAPTGSATGVVNTALEFTASGATSSEGHTVEFRFDWGDAVVSDWGAAAQEHAWANVGTYIVKAQARCVDHTDIVSGWSLASGVEITSGGVEVVSAPPTFTGPTSGLTGQSLNYAVGTATNSEGHVVEYQFDFGDGVATLWQSTRSGTHVWTTAGTYVARARARCETHPDIVSDWSPTVTVTISDPAAETVSAPGPPSMAASAERNETVSISISGGVSSDGHTLQHRVDFGDGMVTGWASSLTTITHAWTAVGNYDVRAQARCATHPAVESDWSAASAIEITENPEVIEFPPTTINGVTDGQTGESYEYSAIHSTETNLGNPVEWSLDWGDGSTSPWSTDVARAASHAWAAAGTYTVVYHVRSSTDPSVTAESDPLTVNISDTAIETVSEPPYVNVPTADRYPTTGDTKSYRVAGGTSSLGHEVETRFDWGDGSALTDWYPNLASVAHTWTDPGTFPVRRQSRCVAHPDVESDWGSNATIVVVRDPETVSTPNAPEGPVTGHRYEGLVYTATGAESSWNHPQIEVRFDWGDGTAISDWSSDLDRSHQFTQLGSYDVRVQARCAYVGHDPIESEWSPATTVDIIETITFGIWGEFHPVGGVGELYEWSANGASSDVGHALEYQFDWGDGTTSDWSTAKSASHAWSAAGSFDVRFRARCIEHPVAVSDWSWPATINVTADPESVSTPAIRRSGFNPYYVGDAITFYEDAAASNYDHDIEYKVYFGDGTDSGWVTEWIQHTYASAGDYEVYGEARCIAHPNVVSEASTPWTLTIQPAP